AQARRVRAIVEHMPQMGIALRAKSLGAGHEEAAITFGGQVCVRRGLPEAWPAGARFELLIRPEQRRAAAGTLVHAVLVVVPVAPGKRMLGALLSRHRVFLG